DARNRQVTCARRGWTRSVPLLRWLRQEFRADRGRGVLFAHVLEDPQGFLEPGPCLGFAAEFAARARGFHEGLAFETPHALPPEQARRLVKPFGGLVPAALGRVGQAEP